MYHVLKLEYYAFITKKHITFGWRVYMITLILGFGLIYFIFWLGFKALGLVFKIALFPIKLVFTLIFAIIGYIVFPALVILFFIPLIVVLISWIIGRIISPI